MGVSESALSNKLTGTDPLQLEDLIEWTMTLGVNIVPDIAALLPPSYSQLVGTWKPGTGSLPVFRSPLPTARPEVPWLAAIDHLDRVVEEYIGFRATQYLNWNSIRHELVHGLLTAGLSAEDVTLESSPVPESRLMF
jgi:hypothetical protein